MTLCLLAVLLVTFLKILKPSPLFADTLFQLKVCTQGPWAPAPPGWLGSGDGGENRNPMTGCHLVTAAQAQPD